VTEHAIPAEELFVPPDKHVAADRAGKRLVNLAGAISAALEADDQPVVVNRKGRHVSIKGLEDLIDAALDGSAPDA
jgi:hypothetical protein